MKVWGIGGSWVLRNMLVAESPVFTRGHGVQENDETGSQKGWVLCGMVILTTIRLWAGTGDMSGYWGNIIDRRLRWVLECGVEVGTGDMDKY